tara:strand:- start:121 stop:294 length:174 start_codon:yes stop_codon:yes gene_type:complete
MSDKVQKGSFTVKDQGKVNYSAIKEEKTNASSTPGMGKGKSRGGGAALRGTKFEGVY